MPELVAASLSDDDDEAAWEEVEEATEPVGCLFCTEQLPSVTEAFTHCANKHDFDLTALRARHGMGAYSYIKLINFIRTHNISPQEIMLCKEPLWDLEMYLKPVLENDPWLMYGKSFL